MECYYSYQHGSWTTQEQCPYCNARNESAEIVRLRAENESLLALLEEVKASPCEQRVRENFIRVELSEMLAHRISAALRGRG